MSIGCDAVLGDGAAVRGHLAPVQNSAVHLGMQGLDPPVEHLGKPVSSEMSFTLTPESRNSLAVPPVEISSTPIPASLRANSTSPVLSVTLRMAR